MIDKQADFMQEIDDDNKRKIVANIYMNSKLGMIYGAAGTGKTRVAEYIAKIFEDIQIKKIQKIGYFKTICISI